jgi:hypothetical protein
MPTLCFTCPNTDRKVSTGTTAPTLVEGLESARRQSAFMHCNSCGESHEWESLTVYLEDDEHDDDTIHHPPAES